MRISDLIARLLTQRRVLVWCAVATLVIASVSILVTRLELDSEVLNMLPGNFESVQGLKIYNRDFEQTRELTFALLCQPGDVDKLEEFAPHFADHLRQQPWCARVLAGSPMETPDGLRDLQSIALPLLLNLAPPDFEKTMSILQPEKMRERLHRLRQQIEAGSPRPQFELEFDPLGLNGPALKPLAEGHAIEEDQPLASSDRTMRIFIMVSNQESVTAFDCQRLMQQVDEFRARARDGWDGGPLEVFVTGRAAYVAEISLSMHHDIVVTLLGSVLLVGTVFFVGFRRWLPLLGMGFALLLSCLVALALGLLIFGRLNMVTVGFCAILVGLGVDFAILIFGRYQQARADGEPHREAIATSIAKLGRAVFFGALTTAVVALVVGSSNFLQGSWLVIVLVPLLMLLLLGIHNHYRDMDRALALDRIPDKEEVAPRPIVIVPISRLDKPARQAIAFANSISKDAVAVHVTNDPEAADAMRERWPAWAGTTELVVVESPYRALIGPLLAYMDALQRQAPDRPILVVLAEFVPRHWWENLLHNQTALRLKLRLFARRNTIVADVPYHPPPA